MINECLLLGKDIHMVDRTKKEERENKNDPRVGVGAIYLDMADDELSLMINDSKDMANTFLLSAIENNKKEYVTLGLSVKQAKEISKALRRFVLAHELVEKAHEKKSVLATNPAWSLYKGQGCGPDPT